MATKDDFLKLLETMPKKYDFQIGQLDALVEDAQFITTGNLAIDYSMGGGVPLGRTVEFHGPPSSGKTTAALQVAAELQQVIMAGGDPARGIKADDKILYLDFEQAMDKIYAANLGLDVNHETFLFGQPDTLEAGCNAALELLKTGKIRLVIIDSVAAMNPSAKAEAEIGKSQPLWSRVLTPSGWKQMGDLRVGDEVVDPRGQQSHIIRITPQGKKQTYRVTFEDGRTAESSSDHLWTIVNPNAKRDGVPTMTLTLSEIVERLVRLKNRVHIPLLTAAPVGIEEALPFDPYALGLLIGDGSFTQKTASYVSADPELVDALASNLPGDVRLNLNTSTAQRVAKSYYLSRKGYRDGVPNPVRTALAELGLWGHGSATKFVPDLYKMSGPGTRLAVLQGLMDTDGYVQVRGGGAEYLSASVRLATDVQYLVRSLGGKARLLVKTVNGMPYYRVHIVPPTGIILFRLARKVERQLRHAGGGSASLAISSIEPIGEPEEHQCIAVSAESSLYLTDGFTVTHNSLPAVAAKLLKDFGATLNSVLSNANASVIFINHLIEKFDMGGARRPGMPALTTTPGGIALKFFASVRVEFKQVRQNMGNVTDPLTNEEVRQPTSTDVKVKVVKNKVAPPFRECVVRVRLGLGFDNFWTALQILLANKKIMHEGGMYYFHNLEAEGYAPPWMDRAKTGTHRPYIRGEANVFLAGDEDPDWRIGLIIYAKGVAADNVEALAAVSPLRRALESEVTEAEDIDALDALIAAPVAGRRVQL